MTPMRYVVLVLAIIISLHFILSFSHEEYGRTTSISHIAGQLKGSTDDVEHPYPGHGSATYDGRRANATFVLLARNSDLNGMVTSMKQMEDRFNKQYQYPYVFLNEEPFSDEFKSRILALTDAKVEFGLIPRDDWYQPDWIDETKAEAARKEMINNKVIYGGSVPYRNMCRFNSGFFYRHELLQKYRYYWRLDPDVTFFCDLDYDPFLLMEEEKKVYGFTLSLYEYHATIPTLWDAVKEFTQQHPEYLPEGNAMAFISDDGGESYNNCHFWSNFEIADMDFWRSQAYSKFFEFLDSKGGFYYERWGDAPVHSIGAALFAKKEQIHFFNEIGYRHNPFQHCPQGELHQRGHCWCDPKDNFDYEGYSCTKRYDDMF
ncbi:glycosyltransferase family 15 protein [Laetiporus sulphureus 93-53]|uniref:Glycosyltransferase family 15 protein n=1 Tax=Laetiporus sulphureus 93-53 TaxID=1314785 RepID=A0A165FB90_9APHY|nr:glycosyltransferase family 15 protein [Laetiporus sulphureus 93-53]KZT08704.1 glycosyltransferase family 15 protein [Laetiporus sulphureus 93-53]